MIASFCLSASSVLERRSSSMRFSSSAASRVRKWRVDERPSFIMGVRRAICVVSSLMSSSCATSRPPMIERERERIGREESRVPLAAASYCAFSAASCSSGSVFRVRISWRRFSDSSSLLVLYCNGGKAYEFSLQSGLGGEGESAPNLAPP